MNLLVKMQKSDGVSFSMRTESPVRFGRNPLNDLQLEDPQVSSWHGALRFDNQHIVIVDLGSTNGTFVNGRRLPTNTELAISANDKVRMGNIEIAFSLVELTTQQFNALYSDELPSEPTTVFSTVAAVARQSVPSPRNARTVMMAPDEVPLDIRPIRQAMATLGNSYGELERAWQNFEATARHLFESLAPKNQRGVAECVMSEMPMAASTSRWSDLLVEFNIHQGTSFSSAEWLTRLRGQKPARDENVYMTMETVGALMETFASSFVAMQRAVSQFGDEIGLRLDANDVFDGQDGASLLRSLTQPGRDPDESVQALKRGFAELAMHQVALFQATLEGVRNLLESVSPDSLESPGSALANSGESSSALDFVPFLKRSRLWKKYTGVHAALMEERRYSRELFGRVFALAYYRVVGRDGEGV